MGELMAVCVSETTGQKKQNVGKGLLIENYGLKNDAHAGGWHRQVSLLSEESIEKMQNQGLDVSAGDFAENLTTKNIKLYELPIGTRIYIGEDVKLEVTQIGKQCHDRCAIYHQAGDCVMPKEGIFARVLKGGKVSLGDKIQVIIDEDGFNRKR
ncbi:MOSC domain-containing protein [Natranaerobius trueperi]|uniref:MOSC domain-containing protein n=1 Tax=Natranaerobius trueperi TaxID=759412 RepID=A0A226BZS2_9FIRM|nr:MOSC domain-containing protein [Natranaerobius trueperi]